MSKIPPESDPELLVQRAQLDSEIERRIELGQELLDLSVVGDERLDELADKFQTWDDFNKELLGRRFSTRALASEYQKVGFTFSGRGSWQQELKRVRSDISCQLRKLVSIRGRLGLIPVAEESASVPRSAETKSRGSKIFVVHGHDGDAKLQVAEFLEQTTGQRPIILHELADSGRTIIEKFEDHASEAGFAVVLLTGDDFGHDASKETPNKRARQNVVFELGFFLGTLGRESVVALYEDGVELPSDLTGVLYKPMVGNWHTELAKELRAAGIHCDLGKLQNSEGITSDLRSPRPRQA
ncbi:MAG: nucleotide-binding protein [Acidimicrobiaceae bacterium]|nr:nucleotide-binding protein [Acidimicrobiaceae bacterium]